MSHDPSCFSFGLLASLLKLPPPLTCFTCFFPQRHINYSLFSSGTLQFLYDPVLISLSSNCFLSGLQTMIPSQQPSYQSMMGVQQPQNPGLLNSQRAGMGGQMQSIMVQYPQMPSYQVWTNLNQPYMIWVENNTLTSLIIKALPAEQKISTGVKCALSSEVKQLHLVHI